MKKHKYSCGICGKSVWNGNIKLCRSCYETEMSSGRLKSNNWKGGITYRSGYRFIYKPDHPFSNNIGYVREHRLVMEQYLDRYLRPDEVVHHLNGNPLDNRIENLVLTSSQSEHVHEFHGNRPIKICSICSGRVYARNLCEHHYWTEFLKEHRRKH